jgi:hypothetical protein
LLVTAARVERDAAIVERDPALSQMDHLRHLLRQLHREKHRHHRTQSCDEFVVHTRPTKLQQKALDLLAIKPATCTQ